MGGGGGRQKGEARERVESHRPLNHPLANTEKRSTVASRQTTVRHTDTGTECPTAASRQTTVRPTDTGVAPLAPFDRQAHGATKRNGRWVALLRDASVYYYLLLLIVKKQLRMS